MKGVHMFQKAVRCPECRRLINAHGGQPTPPEEGDISMCLYCRSFLKFTKGATKLELLTPEEIVELDAHVRHELIEAREFFREHQPE